MSARDQTLSRSRVDWGRAEFVLTLLGFLAFLALPIRLTTIYSGLPAHPLIIHVPVVLVPATVVVAIVFMARSRWLARYGVALALTSIVAMGAVFLALQSGGALRDALHLEGQAAAYISDHSEAAQTLAILYVLFTATLIVAFAAGRISGGRPTGLAIVDRLLSPAAVFKGLRVAVVVLALVCGFFVYRVGDLGAKAVWAGQIQSAEARPHRSND